MRLVNDFRSILSRYDFHGYGNAEDDNGIVVFAADRIVLKEVVSYISPGDYSKGIADEFRKFHDIEGLREYFQRNGSRRAHELAKQVDAFERPVQRERNG